jgi:ribonuclease VapC
MFLDASAIVAILAQEDDADGLLAKIEDRAGGRFYSALSAYEAIVSLARIITNLADGPNTPIQTATLEHTHRRVLDFFAVIGAKEIPISGTTLSRAVDATRTYGKLVGSPARLNLADCFAYACAKENGIPMLFKGSDFPQTDMERA